MNLLKSKSEGQFLGLQPIIIFFLFTFLANVIAQAQNNDDFPGTTPDYRTLKTQEKAATLYTNGDYPQSLRIYTQELAPIGDKYAQYMVGFMHLAGQGVARNLEAAVAWYGLAAERQTEEFVSSHNDLRALLNKSQIEYSDILLKKLKRTIGDKALIIPLIKQDIKQLKSHTGSRVRAHSVMLFKIYMSGYYTDGTIDYQRTRARIRARMEFLQHHIPTNEDTKIKPDYDLESLTREVDQLLGPIALQP
jgi:TPR repeat protein